MMNKFAKVTQEPSPELNKLRDLVRRMLLRSESGASLKTQSLRKLDSLVLEILKQQPVDARGRNIEVLSRAEMSLKSVLPAEITTILEVETEANRSIIVKKLSAILKIASALHNAALPAVFNPLDYRILGNSIASALESANPHAMPPTRRFQGVGVYALYYVGDFPPYRPLVDNDGGVLKVPIYVGKAVPEGARIGGGTNTGAALFGRLKLHGKSISEAATTLRPEDFFCRWLIVEPAFVLLGEVVLLAKHQPLWNSFLYGFGSNPAGKGRKETQKSLWDTLHPGRVRATGFEDAWDREELMVNVERHLRGEKVDQRLLRIAKEIEADDAYLEGLDAEEV